MVEQHIQEACLSVDKLPENMNKVGIEWKSVILEIMVRIVILMIH